MDRRGKKEIKKKNKRMNSMRLKKTGIEKNREAGNIHTKREGRIT